MMAISDGQHLYALPASQDHKQAFDGDRGPNTGGMGCYSPVPIFPRKLYQQTLGGILQPTVRALAEEGRPFVGASTPA